MKRDKQISCNINQDLLFLQIYMNFMENKLPYNQLDQTLNSFFRIKNITKQAKAEFLNIIVDNYLSF